MVLSETFGGHGPCPPPGSAYGLKIYLLREALCEAPVKPSSSNESSQTQQRASLAIVLAEFCLPDEW